MIGGTKIANHTDVNESFLGALISTPPEIEKYQKNRNQLE